MKGAPGQPLPLPQTQPPQQQPAGSSPSAYILPAPPVGGPASFQPISGASANSSRRGSGRTPHINYAWRSEHQCGYPRLRAGHQVTVFAPNHRPPAQQIPSDHILVTRGVRYLDQVPPGADITAVEPAPLCHCAHYYFNRQCRLGEECGFVHAIHIDQNAVEGQKAPPPPVVPRSKEGVSPSGTARTEGERHRNSPPSPISPIMTGIDEVNANLVLPLSFDANRSPPGAIQVLAPPTSMLDPSATSQHQPIAILTPQPQAPGPAHHYTMVPSLAHSTLNLATSPQPPTQVPAQPRVLHMQPVSPSIQQVPMTQSIALPPPPFPGARPILVPSEDGRYVYVVWQ